MEKDRRIIKVVFRILMISGFCLLGISCHYHAIIGKSDLKTISQECIEESDTEKIIKNGDYSLILREGDEGFAVFLQNGKEIVGSQELPAWIIFCATSPARRPSTPPFPSAPGMRRGRNGFSHSPLLESDAPGPSGAF